MHSHVKMRLVSLKTNLFFHVPSAQNVGYEWPGNKSVSLGQHKWSSTQAHLESLQFETESLMTETSDSGIGREGAPSEFGVDIGGQYLKVKITHTYFLFLFTLLFFFTLFM